MRENHFKINEANVIFIVLAFVFLTLGAYVQRLDVITGLLITEYGILLLPIMIYALVTKKNIKEVFRLNKLPFNVVKNCIFGLVFGTSHCIGEFVSAFFHRIVQFFHYGSNTYSSDGT